MGIDPVVSVCIITYNQEKYIAQAIESVLAQQCNFKYELIIGEDCSKDRTREIVRQYAEKYPDIIVPLLPEKNLGPQGNSNNCFMHVRGKYFAFLEGDDFWTDTTKLQRQYDFMEAHPGFSMCFTRADAIDDTGNHVASPFPEITKDEFTIEDAIMADKVFMPTATTFSRNILPKPMPRFFLEALSGDIASHLLLGDKGKFKCLPGRTAVYREHSGGVTKNPKQLEEGYKRLFKLYIDANEYFGYKYDKIFKRKLSEMAKVKLIYGSRNFKGLHKLKYVYHNAPDYFKYSDTLSVKEVAYYFTILFLPFLVKRKKV